MNETMISIKFLLLLFITFISTKAFDEISSSQSITFSYQTCLPNVDLIRLEHYHPVNSQYFHLLTKNFRLHLIYTYENETLEYQFGHLNLSLPTSASFDYQFQAAIDYYHEIDTWHFVNITFDHLQSKIFLSFNTDETRLIPIVDYPWTNPTNQFHVRILLDDQQRNVTCLLPHSGFENPSNDCSINIKTCEHRTCTSTNNAEEFCPLFKIFDCRPFTDLECGLKTIPVRCLNNHCQNRGVCYVDLLRNLTQCVCPSGFAGDQCQYSINECQSNPCPKHSHCIDLPNSYTCVCDPGWTGIDCSEDIDECQTMQPCKAARSCINLPGTYKCDCLESFAGQNCEMTLDPCFSQPCLNDAIKCHPILESNNVVFRCTCQSGFTGQRCETNINDCEGIICPKNHTHCVDGINSFDCQCETNFKKVRDGSCVEMNPCDSSPCFGNATCYNLNHGQYRCMCPPTYTGNQCETDIDECKVFPSICRNGGTCVNENGSYRCYCSSGWIGSTCAKAIDFCQSQPCQRNATCINKINGYECRCLSAYAGDVCQHDIDECLINPCMNNGTCYNYIGGFHCQCLDGYFGHHCEYSPTECRRLQQANLSIKCNDPQLCIVNDTEKLKQLNQLSSLNCQTERDRILNEYFNCPKDSCPCPSNVLPCLTNTSEITRSCPCQNGGTCFWLNSTDYRCYCPEGLTGQNCLTEIDLCISRPCYNNGTCHSQLNSFMCQCPKNARGTYCQEYVDPCEQNPCLNNGTCQRIADHYQCQCSSNLYTGEHCQIVRTPCSSSPCQNHGKCIDRNETFECQCAFQYTGRFCQDSIDLCRTSVNTSLCLNGGECQVKNHTINCQCLAGFTGLFCETNIDDCYTRPCSPHGDCLDLINGYQCQCHSGWFGYNCDRERTELAKTLLHRTQTSSIFHLRNSSINISAALIQHPRSLPMRIQYEFRTTLQRVSLLAIGNRFEQELINGRIVTNFDEKLMLSTFIDRYDDQWISIVVEVYSLWIDVRIGKNSMSQRFYLPTPSFIKSLDQNIIFGHHNYSGCVRQIEVSFSSTYSIVLTDQLIELNEQRMLGCDKYNACQQVVCRKNELCVDHWFYHTCHCQSPYFGEQCDQIAPILLFNGTKSFQMNIDQRISNVSFFFNTIQSNGTLFELNFVPIQSSRTTRDLSNVSNRTQAKLVGKLINGHLRLFLINNEPPANEYELRTNYPLNDGRPHRIQLDLDRRQLIIDDIHHETLPSLPQRFVPNQIEFAARGWLQDIQVNDQRISLANRSELIPLMNNPCYPNNPCEHDGICQVTHEHSYICQCPDNWFGENCSQINRCLTDNSHLCPQGYRCETIEHYQECLASATFLGVNSQLRARFNFNLFNGQISFRYRFHSQSAHLVTLKNIDNDRLISIYLQGENFIYRDSNSTDDLIIATLNRTTIEWTDFHLQWTNESTIIVNHQNVYPVDFTFDDNSTTIEILLGNGFRGCLDDVLLGTNLYIPFYNQSLFENITHRIQVDTFEQIEMNNCTFENVCENIRCEHGHCQEDFDRGICQCQQGWQGLACDVNIDECAQGNNCSKEHSICQDHPDGYYTCKCDLGFTGQFCETNIDDCASSPCANGGICTDLIHGYSCNCTNDYISTNCSIALNDTCLGRFHRCEHNGTCLLKSAHLYVDHPITECQCPPGYNGTRCENDLCLHLNCQYQGTCQRLPNGQARCLCTDQWKGLNCDDDVDECSNPLKNYPCQHNGTCWNYPGGYECRCAEFYLGQHCEREHICLQNSPCLNHGICRSDGEHYYCECSTNFTGIHCQFPTCESVPCQHNGSCTPDSEFGFRCNCTGTGYEDSICATEINECLSNPCFNNATCIDQIDGYTCACSKNFIGPHCEHKKFFAALGFSYHYVIWPGVALLLLLVIILLSVVIGRIRESRRSCGTYRPALNENGQSSRVEFSMILKPPPEERLI